MTKKAPTVQNVLLILLMAVVALVPAAATEKAIDLDRTVARGLAALVRMQAADGSFGSSSGITALGGMALLSGGHTPTRGEYRNASAKALNCVMQGQDPLTGYLGSGLGNMYSHGLATLYLAECYGMSPDLRVRRSLEAALALIYRSQNHEGGWRYEPVPLNADVSVTICQIMAIRGAYNIGIDPGQRAHEVISRAVGYVRSCATGHGTFIYQTDDQSGWGTRGIEAVPRAAAGAMSLIGSGINDLTDPVLGPTMAFLRSTVAEHSVSGAHSYWYGQYYAAQAMFHSADTNDWDRYWKLALPTLVKFQDDDGLWSRQDDYGSEFATAMALIILQIPNNYLPIFQR